MKVRIFTINRLDKGHRVDNVKGELIFQGEGNEDEDGLAKLISKAPIKKGERYILQTEYEMTGNQITRLAGIAPPKE